VVLARGRAQPGAFAPLKSADATASRPLQFAPSGYSIQSRQRARRVARAARWPRAAHWKDVRRTKVRERRLCIATFGYFLISGHDGTIKSVLNAAFLAFLLIAGTAVASDQISPMVASDGVWQHVKHEKIRTQAMGAPERVPTAYRLVHLDVTKFQELVAGAPLEFSVSASNAAPTMTLPMPRLR